MAALQVVQMGQKEKQSSREYNHTPTTLLVAAFGGACANLTVESTFNDVMDMWKHQMSRMPAWQVRMGSACAGILEPVINFIPLESKKYPSGPSSLTMGAWGIRGKLAIQAM